MDKKEIIGEDGKVYELVEKKEKEKKPKNKAKGCLVAFGVIVLISMIIGLFGKGGPLDNDTNTNNNQAQEQEVSRDEYIAFDDQGWENFKEIYTVYNRYLEALTAYDNGDMLNSYNTFKECQNYFGQKYSALNYDGDNEDFQTYTEALQRICLHAQMACKKTIKFVDKNQMKFLSEAEENIKSVTNDIQTYAATRGVFLATAGLTEEEIQQKVDNEIEALDQ